MRIPFQLFFLILYAVLVGSHSYAQVGTSCANPYYVYPASTCSNLCGAQYCGGMQCPTASCGYITMTGSTGGLDGSCAGNDATQVAAWVQVTATATSFSIYNDAVYTGSPGGAHQANDYVIYSGTCGSLTQVACYTIGGNSTQLVSGLTAGQTYYIMITPPNGYDSYTAVSACVTSTTPYAPPGNTCAGAVSLTTNTTYTYTNANATVSGPICSGSVENNTWYQWCAPSTWPVGQQAFISVNSQVCNSTQGLQLSVWNTGGTCPTSAANPTVVCQNPGSLTQYYYQWTAVANQCYYITIDGFAGTACRFNLTVGSVIVLPVELLAFDAAARGNFVDVTWTTATEHNNDYFTVERSDNGEIFSAIGTVKGSGTTTIAHNYGFADKEPLSGLSYYRLRQTDFDGTQSVSATVAVKMSRNQEVNIFPNPFKEEFSVSIHALNSDGLLTTISVEDMSGKVIEVKNIATSRASATYQFSNANWNKGVYILKVHNENGTEVYKLVKQ